MSHVLILIQNCPDPDHDIIPGSCPSSTANTNSLQNILSYVGKKAKKNSPAIYQYIYIYIHIYHSYNVWIGKAQTTHHMVHFIRICTQHDWGVQGERQICLLMSSRLPPLCHLKFNWDARKNNNDKSDIQRARSHNAEGKYLYIWASGLMTNVFCNQWETSAIKLGALCCLVFILQRSSLGQKRFSTLCDLSL